MKATTNAASLSSFHYVPQCQTASAWQYSICTPKSIRKSRPAGFDSRDAEKQPRRRGGGEGEIAASESLAWTASPGRWRYGNPKPRVNDWKGKRAPNGFLGEDSTLLPTESYRKSGRPTLRTKVNRALQCVLYTWAYQQTQGWLWVQGA